jgi:hypothetical protein
MALTGAGLNSMRSIPTFGTIGAIAEIVDNSIQWKTEKDVEINIIFIQKDGSLEDILITDNGKGMGLDSSGREIIDYCLLFGGGTNHGASAGLGRYGIGLPFGCCSQSRQYDVYSWQQPKKIKHKWRDHDDFNPDDPIIDKPFELIEKFPKYFNDYLPNLNTYKSGTIIHWKNCDRLTYKKAVTLINHLENKLGRIYRHFIGNGVSINFRAYNQPKGNTPTPIEELCKEIRKFDPLFLEIGTIAPPPHDTIPSSDLFGKEEIVPFKDSMGINHEIKISASLAKKEIQRPGDKAGGNTPIGKLYSTVQGISLVRAKRELKISHFDFPFPNGISDPRHRWWKIEVQFEPVSDIILDVNANKTDAQHFRFISDENQQDQGIDYIKLRYILSAKINNLIIALWSEIQLRVEEGKGGRGTKTQKCPYCTQDTLINGKCSNPECKRDVLTCQASGHDLVLLVNGICPVCKDIETSKNICPIHKTHYDETGSCHLCEREIKIPLSEDEKDELFLILEGYREFKGGPESVMSLIEWFARSNKKHFVIFVSNPVNPSQLFEIISKPEQSFKIILVNKNHPFYESHIGPLRELANSGKHYDSEIEYDFENALESLILFIITWADTEKSSTSDQPSIQRFRTRFGIDLNETLEKWNS